MVTFVALLESKIEWSDDDEFLSRKINHFVTVFQFSSRLTSDQEDVKWSSFEEQALKKKKVRYVEY